MDKELIAAAKQVKTEVQNVRKEARVKRVLGKLPKPDEGTNP